MASGPEERTEEKYQSILPTEEKHSEELLLRRLFLRKGKLTASSRTSALMSGFAMVAMVEIQIEDGLPAGLIIAFSVLTTVLISIHVFALMISVCILPNLESISNLSSFNSQDIDYSAHEHLHYYIETAWLFSTGLGTLLFLAEVALISWVQFYKHSQEAAIASTCVLVPVSVIFMLFALHFYNTLVKHKYKHSTQKIEELQIFVDKLQPADIHTV